MVSRHRFELPRGDNPIVEMTFTDDDDTALDITDAVVRASIRRQLTTEPVVEAHSYPGDTIIKSVPLSGIALWRLRIEDTHELTPGEYHWDGEVTTRGALVTDAATITVTSGSEVATVSGVALADLRLGDVIELDSAEPENAGSFVVTEVGASGIIIGGYSGWSTETVGLSVWRGRRGTPIRGTWTVLADVTR